MPSESPKPRRARHFRLEQRLPLDAFIMLVYVAVVYGWGVGILPLGRDYALLSGDTGALPGPMAWLWQAEVRLFGSFSAAYHLLNIALMHGAMVCLYLFVNYTLRGPAWLGVLAANLFMANPLHTESLLNHAGALDLIPCLAALAALAWYARAADTGSNASFMTALYLAAAAAALSPRNAFLPALLLLYEGLLAGSHRRSRKRLAGATVLLVGAIVWHFNSLTGGPWSIEGQIVPLYFTVYCLGFLPETMERFVASPAIAWSAAAAVIGAALVIHAKARRAAVPFALFACVLLQVPPLERPVDPVHLIGGGQLLLPQALVMFAVAALYQRVMEHPRWRMPLIYSSFSVSVIFFALAMIAVFAWRGAAAQVSAFQASVRAIDPAQTVAVAPDFRYHRGAPLMLSESVRFDTPFGTGRPVESFMRIHLPAPAGAPWRFERLDADGAVARFAHRSAAAFRPYSSPWTEVPGERIETAEEAGETRVAARFDSPRTVPAARVSIPSPGEEAGSNAQGGAE